MKFKEDIDKSLNEFHENSKREINEIKKTIQYIKEFNKDLEFLKTLKFWKWKGQSNKKLS
jgi:hypothetical protein